MVPRRPRFCGPLGAAFFAAGFGAGFGAAFLAGAAFFGAAFCETWGWVRARETSGRGEQGS